MRLNSKLSVAIAVAAFFSALPGFAGEPKAIPVEPIKSFDQVARGELLVHDFLIKNEGDATLEITNVHPACGCTVASFDEKIEPGKVGKVTAKVDTQDFSGPISKSIAVFTSDKTNPKLQLVVKADVKPYIGVDPGYARYSYVQGEDVKPIGQTLWTEDGRDVRILRLTSPYDHLVVSHREATEEERHKPAKGKQWRIEVVLKTDAPVGPLKDWVEVETDHPKQKIVRLPISGFVRPRQHLTPPDLDFGELQGASLPLQRTFHMTNFITNGIEISKVESSLPAITTEVIKNEKQPGHRFQLVVKLGPEMPKGDFETVLKIHTTDPKNPVLSLPLKGRIL